MQPTIKKGDLVKISAKVTGIGVMDGMVIRTEPFFDKTLITAMYVGDSIAKAHPQREVQGYEDSFAIMSEEEAKEKKYILK